MNYLLPLISVLLGYAVALILKPKNKTNLKLLLAFSGSFLLSITVMHLLPEVYEEHNHQIGIFIMMGILFQIILEFFSKGAEHGHIHVQENTQFPWALFISICIHAFMEGIPLAHNHHHEFLLWAIVIHKVPIAIILGTFFVKSNIPKMNSILFLLMFSLMSPLGSLAGENITFLTTYKTEITAIIIGIFLHISTIILFETSKDHKFNLLKFIAILVGMAVAYMV